MKAAEYRIVYEHRYWPFGYSAEERLPGASFWSWVSPIQAMTKWGAKSQLRKRLTGIQHRVVETIQPEDL